MNQLLTKRTLSLGRINLFLKYKIRLKNALASNIESKFHLEVFFQASDSEVREFMAVRSGRKGLN